MQVDKSVILGWLLIGALVCVISVALIVIDRRFHRIPRWGVWLMEVVASFWILRIGFAKFDYWDDSDWPWVSRVGIVGMFLFYLAIALMLLAHVVLGIWSHKRMYGAKTPSVGNDGGGEMK